MYMGDAATQRRVLGRPTTQQMSLTRHLSFVSAAALLTLVLVRFNRPGPGFLRRPRKNHALLAFSSGSLIGRAPEFVGGSLPPDMEEDVANKALDPWLPPNDRQLALRAKLRFGWSPKSSQIAGLPGSPSASHSNSCKNLEPITPNEQETILQVIRRAEMVTEKEHVRVGKLLERVRNIKKNAVGGDGVNQCVLCGDRAGLFASFSSSGRHVTCKDCAKTVCQKCSVDTWSSGHATTYLCKLCSEQRETWKKSGAWFYEQG